MPERIQRSRARGWRMPDNAVYVGRPGLFGNPFRDLDIFVRVGASLARVRGKSMWASDAYRCWLSGDLILSREVEELVAKRRWVLAHLHELRGRDLACWCRELMPCHADVLLELANG